MTQASSDLFINSEIDAPYSILPGPSSAQVIIVCEHASAAIPSALSDLGLSEDVRYSHIAWDPGALGVAEGLAKCLSAPLVQGTVSRLIYDLNRPPEAATAIPEWSEVFVVPGNHDLPPEARDNRVRGVYFPFRDALSEEISSRADQLQLLVTVHSFTPIFKGKRRDVELGVLHGRDARFAEEMLRQKPDCCAFLTELNEPYSAADGVAHTLDTHGSDNALFNVMLEIRNDLIATHEQQSAWAEMLAPWLLSTLAALRESETCSK